MGTRAWHRAGVPCAPALIAAPQSLLGFVGPCGAKTKHSDPRLGQLADL